MSAILCQGAKCREVYVIDSVYGDRRCTACQDEDMEAQRIVLRLPMIEVI